MTLQEMARQYRQAAAMLSLRLRELQDAGDDPEMKRRRGMLDAMLREVRETAALLDSYYDAPREGPNAATGYFAKKVKSNDS